MSSDKTTVSLRKTTVERLQDKMPYESTTYDEVVTDLLDMVDENNGGCSN